MTPGTDRPDIDAIETAWYNDARASLDPIPTLLDYIGELEAALDAARARDPLEFAACNTHGWQRAETICATCHARTLAELEAARAREQQLTQLVRDFIHHGSRRNHSSYDRLLDAVALAGWAAARR